MEIMTRKQALFQRLEHYFTGKPCKYGHISKRKAINGDCLECMPIRYKQWSQTNNRKPYLIHKAKTWRMTNPDRMRENNIAWNASNRFKRHELGKQWALNNPYRVKAIIVRRMTKLQQATPPWINLKAMEQVYANCPKGFHVDHIVPLSGYYWLGTNKILVSGLNVPWNLQYLAPNENWRKQHQLTKRDLKIARSLKPNRKV